MRKAVVLVIALVLVSACATGVSAQSQKGNYWVSLPLSVVVPTGDLADVASTGVGIGFGLGYWITNSWLIDGTIQFHNFGEKEVSDELTINGATTPIEIAIAYYFLKDSRYRPYATIRAGYMNYQEDFREEWALGQKNSSSTSIGVGMAFLRGEFGQAMLFVEPNIYATYADETLYYWSFNFGIAWNIGG